MSIVVGISSFAGRKVYQDPRMLLQPKGGVLHLPNSSERVSACGCKCPVPNSLMRLRADEYMHILVTACPDCDQPCELDTSCLTRLAGLSAQPEHCAECSGVEGVVRAEVVLPNGDVTWGHMCGDCIEKLDEQAMACTAMPR